MENIILTSGTQFFYEERLPRFGNPTQIIMFIPGAYQTSWANRHIIQQFSQYYPSTIFLTLNLTHFGKSHNSNYTRDTDADILESSLIEDIQLFYLWYRQKYPSIMNWDIFSYSFGTYCALKWIFRYKPQIGKLVVCCPYGIFPNVGKWGIFIGTGFKHSLYSMFISFCNYFFKYSNYIIEPHNYSDKIISNTFCLSNGYLTSCFLDKMHDLMTLNIATYLIFGSQDTISPYEQGNILQMMFPESIKRCFIVHDSGHSDLLYNREFLKILEFIFFDKRPRNTIQYVQTSLNFWQTQKRLKEYYLSL